MVARRNSRLIIFSFNECRGCVSLESICDVFKGVAADSAYIVDLRDRGEAATGQRVAHGEDVFGEFLTNTVGSGSARPALCI